MASPYLPLGMIVTRTSGYETRPPSFSLVLGFLSLSISCLVSGLVLFWLAGWFCADSLLESLPFIGGLVPTKLYLKSGKDIAIAAALFFTFCPSPLHVFSRLRFFRVLG